MSLSPPPLKRRRVEEIKDKHEDRASHDLLVYSWNVNGIDALIQPSISHFFGKPNQHVSSSSSVARETKPLSPLQVVLARHGWPELYFLQEVKIKLGDETTMRAVRKAVASKTGSNTPGYETHFCLPSRKYTHRGSGARVYGVCTLIRSDFADAYVERTEQVTWDTEGRFLVTYTRKIGDRPRMAIWNVYMVNGTTLPYRDPVSGEIIGTRHDRKLEVHALLQQHCHRLQDEGYSVVIAGDINVARTPLDGHPNLRTFPVQHIANRVDFEQRFLATINSSSAMQIEKSEEYPLGMIDTYRELHASAKGYTYYSRHVPFRESCDRVDMILASNSLKQSCVAAGMHENELDRGPSDHVPIFAKFHFASS